MNVAINGTCSTPSLPSNNQTWQLKIFFKWRVVVGKSFVNVWLPEGFCLRVSFFVFSPHLHFIKGATLFLQSLTHAHTHSLIRSLTHSLLLPFPPFSSLAPAHRHCGHQRTWITARANSSDGSLLQALAHPQHARARTPWQAPAQQHARARTLSRAPAHERISQKMPDRMS